ncbi:MAG: DNA-formamidopyrimidine glycosylase family protein [Thermoleophilaceae bacterium]
MQDFSGGPLGLAACPRATRSTTPLGAWARALVGRAIESIETPHPRHGMDRWPERLAGRGVGRVDARGKHLFVRFEGGLTLHSHLRMTGKWGVYRRGAQWRRAPHRAWLVIRTAEHEVVEFDGPVLELMTEGRTRFDQRLAAPRPRRPGRGASIPRPSCAGCAPTTGRARSASRCSTSASSLASATCGRTRAASWAGSIRGGRRPTSPTLRCSDIVERSRPLMALSAERGGRIVTVEPHRASPGGSTRYWVHGRQGLPCRRCATPIRSRGQGDDNRNTFWCPSCQR